MKKTFLIIAAVILSFTAISVNAQETEKPVPVPEQKQTWDPQNNPTVAAISAKYKDKMIAPKSEITLNDVFPVLGQYESVSNPEAMMVTIVLDPENKGLVWVEGLPQGKIKAMLRQSPATYKIPAQKTEDGKDVAEGTLIFDKEMNALSISIGKKYNAEDPASAFLPAPEEVQPVKVSAKNKIKTKQIKEEKAWIYTGSKHLKEEVKGTEVIEKNMN